MSIFFYLYILLAVAWFVNVPLIIAQPGSADFRKWMDRSNLWMKGVAILFGIVVFIHFVTWNT